MNKEKVKIKVISRWIKADNIKSKEFAFKRSCVDRVHNTVYDFIAEVLTDREFNLLTHEDIERLGESMIQLSPTPKSNLAFFDYLVNLAKKDLEQNIRGKN